jgi:AraC-like DNA-binding protein
LVLDSNAGVTDAAIEHSAKLAALKESQSDKPASQANAPRGSAPQYRVAKSYGSRIPVNCRDFYRVLEYELNDTIFLGLAILHETRLFSQAAVPSMRKSLPEYRDCKNACRPDSCEQIVQSVSAGQLRLHALSRAQYPGKRLLPRILPGLRTVGYYEADHTQHWGTGWHYNEGLELSFLDNGRVTFSAENQDYPLIPGYATATRPWLRHRLGDPHVGPSLFYWLVLDVGVRRPRQDWKWPSWITLTATDRRDMARLFEELPYHVWFGDVTLRRCYHRLGKAIEADREGSKASLLAVLINELLVLLLEEIRTRRDMQIDGNVTSLQVIRLFWEELRTHPKLLARPWTLSALAKHNGLGITQFVTLTRQLMSLSPRHYLQHCRLEQAATLLLSQPELNLTEIALACGYMSSQSFSRDFRQHFGCPAKIYRFSRLQGSDAASP